MAATMGFSEMAELTHKMEDVLSKFREGELKVTENVVTTLFKCLDTLELMVDNISEGIEDEVEIDEIINELKNIENVSLNSEKQETKEEISKEVKEKEAEVNDNSQKANSIELNEYDRDIIKQAIEKSFNVFRLNVELDENTILKTARAFLVFRVLEDLGEIKKSIPSTDDIENEDFEFNIELVFVTTSDKETVKTGVMGVSEIKNVDIQEITLDDLSEPTPKEEIKEKKSEEVKEKEIKEVTPKAEP